MYEKLNLTNGASTLKFIFAVLILDGLLLDDEPLWEPIEWSVVQTWILYIYIFSWAAEVLFSSKYGSYTNRDKIVWIGLFKSYWGMLFWFFINIVIVTVFVTLPFYFEITYSISYSVVWWNWINSIFFFKITSYFSILLILSNILKTFVRFNNLAKAKMFILIIILATIFMFYFNFITTWFGFFTDENLFKKTGWSELSKITNGSMKWGWGASNRDHFAYHKTPTVFWAKNDQLILSSLLFINIFLFLFMFFYLLQLITLYRTLITTNELSHNLINFLLSTTRQMLNIILLLSVLTVLSLIYQFMRFPFELAYYDKFLFILETELDIILDLIFDIFEFLYALYQ